MSENLNAAPSATLLRFLRRPEVQQATGLPRSTLYRLISEGNFPKPVPLTGRGVGWIESEIAEWQAHRVSLRRASAA